MRDRAIAGQLHQQSGLLHAGTLGDKPGGGGSDARIACSLAPRPLRVLPSPALTAASVAFRSTANCSQNSHSRSESSAAQAGLLGSQCGVGVVGHLKPHKSLLVRLSGWGLTNKKPASGGLCKGEGVRRLGRVRSARAHVRFAPIAVDERISPIASRCQCPKGASLFPPQQIPDCLTPSVPPGSASPAN